MVSIGALCPLPCPTAGMGFCLNLFRTCVCWHRLCEFTSASVCFVWKMLIPQCFPLPLAVTIFLPHLHNRFLSLKVGGLHKDIPFRVEWSKFSHHLYISQWWVSVSIPIYWYKRWLGWRLSDILMYGYSYMSFRQILLQCSFKRIIIIGFLLVHWPV